MDSTIQYSDMIKNQDGLIITISLRQIIIINPILELIIIILNTNNPYKK
jgi:hypothetical protein